MHGDIVSNVRENLHYLDVSIFNHILSGSRSWAKSSQKKGTERSLEILNRMRENPFVTQVKLMEEFNLSRKQIQNIIQYLRQNGMVDREGSNRSGKWIVKK